MTQDHLFPKALARPGQRKVTKILHPVDPSRRGRQGTFLAQNGVTKATLCADCNNRVLGTELDPSLIETYKAALSALELCRFPVIPDLHLIGVNLNKVARSVAGHLLALDDTPSPRHVMARQLRRFVLDPKAGLHPSLRFQMWFYPFMRQGMLKDLNHVEFGRDYGPMWISAMKTYPLAFAFSTAAENPRFRLAGVTDLTPYVTTDVEGRFKIRVRTRPIVSINWPFAALPNGAIFTGDNASLTTVPFRKKP
ncbi:hypothetical protein L4Z64_001219 [Pseudomonas aeruginosa]|nr:hypothetical protein [Pseudomonas aeruginosa]MCS8414852.1 hypothetical protein [Pseudomonas aeruginosa]MCS9764359.1 hypothetical protein [Pseudomonas aeruginosa]MCS9822399.1 hypothetical protein [Pseudomonas aeruginosa]MCT0241116.1 hypothetical protein [Pseudomonas aeruginosa]